MICLSIHEIIWTRYEDLSPHERFSFERFFTNWGRPHMQDNFSQLESAAGLSDRRLGAQR